MQSNAVMYYSLMYPGFTASLRNPSQKPLKDNKALITSSQFSTLNPSSSSSPSFINVSPGSVLDLSKHSAAVRASLRDPMRV